MKRRVKGRPRARARWMKQDETHLQIDHAFDIRVSSRRVFALWFMEAMEDPTPLSPFLSTTPLRTRSIEDIARAAERREQAFTPGRQLTREERRAQRRKGDIT
jgi:hypothetical protein